jgi:predicted nucleotidyltransferase component of viral defense system
MKLYYNTISPVLMNALTKLMREKAFDGFRLVGGTALALQLGHRISVDIDLFTDMEYGTMNLQEIAESIKRVFPHVEGLEKLDTVAPGYTLYCGENDSDIVKVDLFYTDPFLFPAIVDGDLRIATASDIAAMKVLAINNASRGKDYWDIHELMKRFSLEEMLNLAEERFPYSIDRKKVITKLASIPIEESDPSIISLKGDYWEFVVEDIAEEAQKLLNG